MAESPRVEEGKSGTVRESGAKREVAKRGELHIVPRGGEAESET